MKQRGRRVPPLNPGERRQFKPGAAFAQYDEVIQSNILLIAKTASADNKPHRGVTVVQVDTTKDDGIVGASFVNMQAIQTTENNLPLSFSRGTLADRIQSYNIEYECVVAVIDITPGLPGPQLFWDVIGYAPTA